MGELGRKKEVRLFPSRHSTRAPNFSMISTFSRRFSTEGASAEEKEKDNHIGLSDFLSTAFSPVPLSVTLFIGTVYILLN